MELHGKKVLVCNCEATMPLDAAALAAALGTDAPTVHTQLCRAQIKAFTKAAAGGGKLLVACTQEAPLFAETADAGTELSFFNIRERAGWSSEAREATPKIAALIAEAAQNAEPTTSITLKSEGVTLVYGRDERAIEAARRLKSKLDVTVLLDAAEDVVPPRLMDIPIFKGRIVGAKGHLGAFGIVVDGYATPSPASRDRFVFGPAKDGASSTCDLILDLSGGTPLFPAHGKREGYLRPDPANPAAVERAIFDVAELVGEFDKPRYVAYDASLCAHARSRKVGCTRCLDVCPTGAISPDGDHVAIDPHVCAGCGSCAAVCPTGAATYALPAQQKMLERLRTLLMAYQRAGGKDAALLLADARHGEELISAVSRFSGGLPAHVLPFTVNEVSQVGLDTLAAAFAWGAAEVVLLLSPNDERVALESQAALAATVLAGLGYGEGRVRLLDEQDPELLAARLRERRRGGPVASAFLPMGGKRTVTMLGLRHLHQHAPAAVERLPLPAGAPFGAVLLDQAKCTLCLACVGACPTGALQDNPDKPMLRFQEEACVQCGICRNTCPENAIALEPRLDFSEAARSAVVLKEEEPAECLRCGKAFGTRSTVERIVAQLAGKHPMFASGPLADRIRMCEDCRVVVQFESPNPLAGKARPKPRTSDDYLTRPDSGEA